MRLPGAGLAARANPVTKLGVGLVVAAAMVLSLDVVTAGTALALEIAALPWCGLGPARLARRTRLLAASALAAGVGAALFAVASGPATGAAVAARAHVGGGRPIVWPPPAGRVRPASGPPPPPHPPSPASPARPGSV